MHRDRLNQVSNELSCALPTHNRPFPSCFQPFTWKWVQVHSIANKIHFYVKGFALGLALKEATWKWPIVSVIRSNFLFQSVDKRPSLGSRSWRVIVDSPLLVLLVSGEERDVKLAPAPRAHSDQIVLFRIPLSIGEGVRIGAGDWNNKHWKLIVEEEEKEEKGEEWYQ